MSTNSNVFSNNERSVVFLVSFSVLRQRLLNATAKTSDMSTFELEVTCFSNDIFMDKCLSMAIQLFHSVRLRDLLCMYNFK